MDILDISLDILLKPPQPFIGLFFTVLDMFSPARIRAELFCAVGTFEESRSVTRHFWVHLFEVYV